MCACALYGPNIGYKWVYPHHNTIFNWALIPIYVYIHIIYIYIVYIYIYMSISGSSSKPFNVSAVRGQPHLEIWAHQHMIDSPPLDRQWSAPPKQHPWHGPWRAMVGDVAISPFQYKVIANEENDNFCQWVNAWVITLSKMNQFPRKQRSK